MELHLNIFPGVLVVFNLMEDCREKALSLEKDFLSQFRVFLLIRIFLLNVFPRDFIKEDQFNKNNHFCIISTIVVFFLSTVKKIR